MKYRDLTRLLKEAWTNGPHSVSITRTREISPGLVRKALNTIEESRQ